MGAWSILTNYMYSLFFPQNFLLQKFEEEVSSLDPSSLIEQSDISGMGVFQAFSDGSLKGHFCDGVVLEIKKSYKKEGDYGLVANKVSLLYQVKS